MKKLLLSFVFIIGCSSSNNLNQVTDALIALKGGQGKGKKWDDSLIFNRHSWYKGASMKYDLFTVKLEKSSPFYSWIGRSQREEIDRCKNFYVTLMYAGVSLLSPSSISELRESFNIVGLKRYSLPVFGSYLKNHYFFLQWNLKNHVILGYCKDSNVVNVEVQIPNFSTVRVLK